MADSDDREFQSGPFCRHWSDPAYCDNECATCGHKCCQHDRGDYITGSSCNEDGCGCQAWSEKET